MKTRILLACAFVGCAPAEPTAPPEPGPRWVYAPAPVAGTLGVLRGRLGRSQAPHGGAALGITGDPSVATTALRLPTPWAVPGDPPRAVIDGLEGVKRAIELVEVDAGRVRWRDTVHCAAPVAAVTVASILCADARGVRAVGLDGKPRWTRAELLATITGERVVLIGPTEAIVRAKPTGRPVRPPVRRRRPVRPVRPLPVPPPVPATRATAIVVDATTGQDTTRVKLPPGFAVEHVLAACDGELFATAQGKLARIVGDKLAWAVPVGAVAELLACGGDAVVIVTPAGNDRAVIAFARATGVQTGRVDGVRGHWPARDGSDRIELATAVGVASWSRDLKSAQPLELLPLGELLAQRGERRLVRATPFTAVVLDRNGVAAYLPFAAIGAVLGDTSVVGGTWVGSPAESVRRFALPERTRRVVRIPARRGAIALPAELRDLPEETPLDPRGAIAKPDTGMLAVDAIALDPAAPTQLFVVARERPGAPATVAGVELAQRSWRWQRGDGCGTGQPIGLALGRDTILCAARGVTSTITATSRDGAARWEWETDELDALAASGDVVLGFAADRVFVLDGTTGMLRGTLASGDGAAMRATVVTRGVVTVVVTYERGRLVVRSPHTSLLALWSLAIDGVVTAISPSLDGVLVELDDGDAFRVDLATGQVVPLPGLGLAWHATGDLVTAEATGGVIPAPPIPRPVVRPPPGRRVGRRPIVRRPPPREPGRPAIWTPMPMPPPLGDSWQYTLFEPTGGVRARNDYALSRPIEPPRTRGPTGSPLVVAHGASEVLVLDPRNGDPVRRVALPAPGLVFGTIVDGTPVAGAVLAQPLRVVMF